MTRESPGLEASNKEEALTEHGLNDNPQYSFPELTDSVRDLIAHQVD